MSAVALELWNVASQKIELEEASFPPKISSFLGFPREETSRQVD